MYRTHTNAWESKFDLVDGQRRTIILALFCIPPVPDDLGKD